MHRAPALSVRLKLTLSYAGFLMLAGALLLSSSSAVSPSPAMSAAIAARRSPSRMAPAK